MKFKIEYTLYHSITVDASQYDDTEASADRVHTIETENAAEFLTDVLSSGDGRIEVKVTEIP